MPETNIESSFDSELPILGAGGPIVDLDFSRKTQDFCFVDKFFSTGSNFRPIWTVSGQFWHCGVFLCHFSQCWLQNAPLGLKFQPELGSEEFWEKRYSRRYTGLDMVKIGGFRPQILDFSENSTISRPNMVIDPAKTANRRSGGILSENEVLDSRYNHKSTDKM